MKKKKHASRRVRYCEIKRDFPALLYDADLNFRRKVWNKSINKYRHKLMRITKKKDDLGLAVFFREHFKDFVQFVNAEPEFADQLNLVGKFFNYICLPRNRKVMNNLMGWDEIRDILWSES